MTVDEVAALLNISRRTLMRKVHNKELPPPDYLVPLSWNYRTIRAAVERLRKGEEQHGRSNNSRTKRNGRSKRARRAKLGRNS